MEAPQQIIQEEPAKKAPVVRGARACTVCRTAKMKCVGSEDGTKPCQRCKRANVECIFEKHRRGRKPGSKLSEASKMLRRLEKGLSSAKLKSQANDASMNLPFPISDARMASSDPAQYRGVLHPESASATRFPGNELPPIQGSPNGDYGSSRHDPDEDDEDDHDKSPSTLYPAKLIRTERNRNSFFKTILNPQHEAPLQSRKPSSSAVCASPSQPTSSTSTPTPVGPDPITAGIMDDHQARLLFDLVFLRLNPFVNLFDPALHSVQYVRSKSAFLFTALLMAGAKFFKHELYRPCLKLLNELAVQAFTENSKSVEVVQAFACLTYWKEPEDTRTWTYIGYACRMAVELGLNKYVQHRPPHETELQLLERRNRERTYLVLFVHDRSLSMQTGRQWMLPEDEFVRRSVSWHDEAGLSQPRPEDVILAAFVELRRIATEAMETSDAFCLDRNSPQAMDVNYEHLLRSCNARLTKWQEFWQQEMQRASGEQFHHAFLNFFRVYVRLFLNSFGVKAYMSGAHAAAPSLPALSACYTSALENLQIITKDFASMSVLRYGQDSITVMSAYSAIFLLKLLRSSSTQQELHPGATAEIHTVINQTADAYEEASQLCPASGSAAYHARFLRSLVANDLAKARQAQDVVDPRMPVHQQRPSPTSGAMSGTAYSQENKTHQFSPSHMPLPAHSSVAIPMDDMSARNGLPNGANSGVNYNPHQPVSELDAYYWKNMFRDLGFGDSQTASFEAFDYSTPEQQDHVQQQHQPYVHQQQPHHNYNALPHHMQHNPAYRRG